MSEIFLLFLAIVRIAQVGTKAESRQQLLLEGKAVHRIQHRRQIEERTVGGLAAVVEFDGKTGSGRKSLRVGDAGLPGVRLQRRHTVDLLIGQRRGLMLSADRADDRRIVRRHCSARAQGRLHQSGRARARSACAASRAARARAGSASAEAANSAAGRSLHHAGINAAKTSAGRVRSMSMLAIGRL